MHADIDYIFQQAFEHSLQANIISIVRSGRIIRANRAACRLLGYSKKDLLARNREDIFRITEESYKRMVLERTVEGSAKADARKDIKNGEAYLIHSSEYMFTAIEEIRKLTKGLMTDTIKDFGLCAAIEDIARDTMETSGLKIHCKLEPSLETAMSDKFKMNAFRIVQEQLNNILKHASASDIHITMAGKKAEFALSIADNGIGFDITKKLNRTGIGISNIISRAEAYRGTARFVTKPGKGCKLVITFPVT
jgi:PAS domain S-box-containing protein